MGSFRATAAALALISAILCAAAAPAPSGAIATITPSPPAAGSSGNSSGLITEFVQRSGTRFVVQAANGSADSCQTFYFAGANAQFLMVFAADPAKRQYVLEILDSAQKLGITVIRMWTFADGATTFNALQRYPGQYDEGTLQGLDFVMDEASRRGIRLVLVFANYWSQYGGVDQYNVWSFQAGTGTCNGDTICRDEFFSDPMAAQYYRDHVSTILTRTNSINGRLYREDPTIFGYNLMNEPRSQQDLYLVNRVTTDAMQTPYNLSYNQGNDLQQWITDMAGYVKSIDPIHLLTIGSEGFAGNYTPMYLYSNPGAWGSLLGVDFVRNHETPGIDYATMHVYVDQWLCVAEGATEDGQLAFMTSWLDAHQQAAEEDLMMPVVLEEFGSKLDARAGQYKLAYDNCLASAHRGGSCAGVMFWDLTHEGYSLVDPWLDGQLRFGGGYSNWLNTSESERVAILDMVSSYASSVQTINTQSAGVGTCVWYPPPAQGLGCKNLQVQLELGGLPWTCLNGEPTGLNWCNAADAASVYRSPPPAWLSTSGRDLPYNTIEGLILGNLTNNGSTPISLQGAWIIVPYSMGVQTQFEGVWERIEDPNSYFTVYCWYVNGNGQDLCNGGVDVTFTNITWPTDTKHDRGLNISFTGDIVLQPGASISTSGGSTQVMLSFKDATNAFRLDVSDLGINGALSCPQDPLYTSYPPPNPPAPKPCTQGPTPNRGCPNLEWYFNSGPSTTVTTAGRRLLQNTGGSGDGTSGMILADPPVSIVNPGPVPGNPINVTQTPARNVVSTSAAISASTLGFQTGAQYIVTAHISSAGQPRVTELISPVAGTTATTTADTPHTDALGDGSNVLGTTVYLVLSFVPQGFNKPVYRLVAGGEVPTNDPSGGYFKGVFELDWPTNVTNVTFFAESPLAGLKLTLTDVALTAPALVGTQPNKLPLPIDNMTDVYVPCVLPQNSGNDAIFVVNLPAGQSDTLNAVLCSPGGYYQSLRLYNNGAEVMRTDPGGVPAVYSLNSVPIKGGSDYVFVIQGSTGDPYGSYRGQPGIRFTWASGQAFEGVYDAAPANISNFVRVDDGNLMLGCDRAAYVGCNTWDLMDKSRYESNRPEVESRMDAMVQAGWSVGRTWGFSLGDGTGQTSLGETVLDPNSVLETAPGVYNEEVWESLDFVLAQAAQRNLRLLIPIEDYWLSIDRYINWSSTAVTKNDFYTDYTIRQLYKDHLKTYVNRVNTYNNRTYRDDPTIYAWDLLNEPRCTGCGYALQAWVEEMSVYMKSIDPNHMLGLGSEGFYSTTCDRVYLNPGAGQRRTGISSSPWASQEGQDFLANAVVPDIDFATTHIWMDNWMGYADYSTCINCDLNFDYTHGGNLWMEKLDYTVSWLQAHIQDAGQLSKPLLVEEFGKAISASDVYTGNLPHSPQKGETVATNDSLRDIFFTTIYGLISQSAQSNGPAQGSNFWNLYTAGIADNDPYKITLGDTSTMSIVAAHQKNLSAVISQPGTCPSGSNSSPALSTVSAAAPVAASSSGANTTTRGTAVPPSVTYTPLNTAGRR